MKKILLLLILLFFTTILLGQNGNVGIGTTDPKEKLHIFGVTSTIRIDGLNSVNNSENNGTNTNLLVDSDGTIILGESSSEKIMGKVSVDNNSIIIGATVVKLETGRYRVNFNDDNIVNDYIILLSIKRYDSGRNDSNISYYGQDSGGFNVEIKNNDDGDNLGDLIDLEFMFKIIKFN